MFSSISMTGTGLALLVLNIALKVIGNYIGHPIEVPNEQLQTIVDAGSQILAFVWLIWGQVRRNDLKAGFIRKA